MEEAFQWPLVVRKNLENILGSLVPGDGKPLIKSGRCLKTTSHFSGVCAQSRAAMVVQAHGMGVTFRHESRLVYAVYFVLRFFLSLTRAYSLPKFIKSQVTRSPNTLLNAQDSFCEKTRQGQATLRRDFKEACVFGNQWQVLEPADQNKLKNANGIEEINAFLKKTEFLVRAKCTQHNYLCRLVRPDQGPDITFFGAPCKDDSTMGTQKQDSGKHRAES